MRVDWLRYKLSLWFLQLGVWFVPDQWVKQKLMLSIGLAAGLIANTMENEEKNKQWAYRPEGGDE